MDIATMAPDLQAFFTETAETTARATKLVQRQSKLTGAVFLQSMVFGFAANPQACLTDLVEVSEDLGVSISRQGLQERIQDAVPFMQVMFERSLSLFRQKWPLELARLQQFSHIFITDSTTVALSPALQAEFPGCGGSGPEAAVKLQLTFELLYGHMDSLELEGGRVPDQCDNLPQGIQPGALYLSDLGYFVVERFQQLDQQQAYFLSRYDTQTACFEATTGTRLDLLAWLQAQTLSYLETEWLIGATTRLPCRVIVVKLPQEVADRRRQKAQEQARRKGRTLSSRHLELLGWNIYITNVPASMLRPQQVPVLYAVRWQIELLFKVWKSQAALDRVAGRRRERTLTELYAKLIGAVIFDCLSAPLRLGKCELSRVRVQHIIQHYALRLAMSLACIEDLIKLVNKIVTRCLKNARKDKRKRPTTLHRLLQVGGA